MTGSNKTDQFLHENVTWKRLLDFFMQENSFLKTRLSEIVDRENNPLFIARAEQFQNEFIVKDESILDIVIDIKSQEAYLQMILAQKNPPDNKCSRMQQKLRNEMSSLESAFFELKNRFNQYLLSIL